MSDTEGISSKVVTRLVALIELARKHWIGVIIGAVGAAIIFSGEIIHYGKEILDLFSHKPDALTLTQEASKDRISREFVETAWRRLFWSNNFLARLKRRAPSSEINEAWKKLITSIEDMNSKLLVYSAAFQQFNGWPRRAEFEFGIQVDFVNVTQDIVNLRYGSAGKKLEFPNELSSKLTEDETATFEEKITSIYKKLDDLNVRLYHFSSCFNKESQTDKSCDYGRGNQSVYSPESGL